MKIFKIKSEKEVQDRILFLTNEVRLRETDFLRSSLSYNPNPDSDFWKVCINEFEFRDKYKDRTWPK